MDKYHDRFIAEVKEYIANYYSALYVQLPPHPELMVSHLEPLQFLWCYSGLVTQHS